MTSSYVWLWVRYTKLPFRHGEPHGPPQPPPHNSILMLGPFISLDTARKYGRENWPSEEWHAEIIADYSYNGSDRRPPTGIVLVEELSRHPEFDPVI